MTKKILPSIRPKSHQNSYPTKVYIPRNDNVPGWVYMVEDLHGDTKVGLSRNVEKRHKSLKSDYGPLKPLGKIWVFRMKDFEDILLSRYQTINSPKADTLSGYTEWHRCGKIQQLEMVFSLYWLGLCFNISCLWTRAKKDRYYILAIAVALLIGYFF